MRVPAFVCGGVVPAANRGKQLHGLVAIADLYATFAAVAGAHAEDSRAVFLAMPSRLTHPVTRAAAWVVRN